MVTVVAGPCMGMFRPRANSINSTINFVLLRSVSSFEHRFLKARKRKVLSLSLVYRKLTQDKIVIDTSINCNETTKGSILSPITFFLLLFDFFGVIFGRV